ncbi:lipocalin family protein [Prevotella pallens]|uniref:lipocalin family protein n=1 Tax=Prevotella pallens TaxID=60133 RepID=UPI0028E23054|nr:lipocalin family protein [Prevotella pallens]
MKQKLFSVVLLLFCALQMNAQSFSEEQLEGTWEFKDEGVEYNEYMGSIKKMKIGDHLASHSFLSGYIEYRWTDKMYEQAKALGGEEFKIEDSDRILDYFITGNDRLHIIVQDDFTLHFKILELNGNTMKLQTKKGIMTFNKTASQVQNVKNETNKVEKARYNINGQRLANPEKGINIVKMTDNSSYKELIR